MSDQTVAYYGCAQVELRDNANFRAIHTMLEHALELASQWDGERVRAAEIHFKDQSSSMFGKMLAGSEIIALLQTPSGLGREDPA